MSITFQVLGDAGRDNALFVRLDSGQAIDRLLFDCGGGCPDALPHAEVQAIDHLCFSHLHMDHVAGFDTFFRSNYDRAAKPNVLWGPPETGRILHGRLRGYWWNLNAGRQGVWRVNDIHPEHVQSWRFELAEAFQYRHDAGRLPRTAVLFDGGAYTVAALALEHQGPSLAYLVREKTRSNIDPGKLVNLGLQPGPWLKELKEPAPGQTTVDVDGGARPIADLRAALLSETAGESIAYLTDFLLDDVALERLVPWLHGCTTVVCECQYRAADAELARRNFHMAAPQVAELARRANVGALVLFHVSDRYTASEWLELLAEARAVFPATRFPEHWRLDV